MQAVSHLAAPAYVFEGMRAVVDGRGVSIEMLGAGLGLSVLCLAGAYLIFVSVYRYAIGNGLVARYSAENAA